MEPAASGQGITASCELNFAIAEKVMGWHRQSFKPAIPGMPFQAEWFGADGARTGRFAEGGGGDYYHPDEEWEPSSRIEHAWEVVERLNRDFEYVRILTTEDGATVKIPLAAGRFAKTMADTVPLAICLAALDAVGYPVATAAP